MSFCPASHPWLFTELYVAENPSLSLKPEVPMWAFPLAPTVTWDKAPPLANLSLPSLG